VIEMARSTGGNDRFSESVWWKLLEDELGRPCLMELLAFVDANRPAIARNPDQGLLQRSSEMSGASVLRTPRGW